MLFTENEISAMIMLLDDNDKEVVQQVESHLVSFGEVAIPYLETRWNDDFSLVQQQKLEQIIHQIQFDALKRDLESWRLSEQQDLFEGIMLLNRFQYPNLNIQEVKNKIEKIRLDAWLELHYELTALEKIRILNHVFYDLHGFKGNTQVYHSPDNSFVNKVLDKKEGNPISLAVLYSIVAQKLGIPVFGINLPQHFILAYLYDKELNGTDLMQKNILIKENKLHKVMFYINPFNKGLIFTRQNVEDFVNQLKLIHDDSFYLPCNNVEILKRVLRNLTAAYKSKNQEDKMAELEVLMRVLGG